jgi:hypothetical protein
MKDLSEVPESFCSIDASTNSMAFAYFVNKELIKYGKIKYTGTDIYGKMVDMSHKTNKFFEQFENLNHIIIEQVIYLNSPKTAANLAMSHGAIVASASITGVDYIASVSPMEWQNWSGNKRLTVAEKEAIRNEKPGKTNSWYKSAERQLRKQKTIRFVNTRYDLHVDDDDVADAIAIGSWAISNWGKAFK